MTALPIEQGLGKIRDNPISRLRRWLQNKELWNEQLEKETRTRIRQAILEVFALAEKEKKPSLSAVFDDVYAELTEEMECQKEEMQRLMVKYPLAYDVREYDRGIEGIYN
jgi:2-oxoisovalerate dehydrogenase E1 component alpha subunit